LGDAPLAGLAGSSAVNHSAFKIEKLIASIRERHGGRTSKRISLDLARVQGNDLIELKTACRHGEFRTLIESRLPFGYSVASDLMKISRQLGNLGRRNARGSLSVRQALSLIEQSKTTAPTTVLSERARTKLAAMATKPPTEADQCRLIEGDCLEEMGKIPDRSVDLILCDLPFGNSGFGWDRPIDLAALWQHYRRVIKPNHPIVLFASQPFVTDLVNAARDLFKYEWIWIKHRPTGSTHAKNMPMKKHENVLVFSGGATIHQSQSKRRMAYYPQGLAPNHRDRIVNFNKRKQIVGYRPSRQKPHLREFTGYPNSVLEFPVDELGLHPVAKPVGLLEFLIETYTRPGEIVLDSAMGMGSTGIAAANTGRRFIGIEKDAEFFQTAVEVLGYSRSESA
jgi:site-specific DNA-methyltransferase (adenine-specific)